MTPEDIIKDMSQLISFPDVVVRALELLDSPSANAAEIGEVISHDPALSARLLKLVNSAYFNTPAKVATISRAVTMIGTDELRSLIMASTVAQTFEHLPAEIIDMDAFWHRSVYCGLAAKKLATLSQTSSEESIFLTGLMHDLGRLILLTCRPEQAQSILSHVQKSGRRFKEVEAEILGFSTSELGAALLKSWNLPDSLWEPVRFQHHPEDAARYIAETRILNLAIKIADCVEPELKTDQTLDYKVLDDTNLNGIQLTAEELCIAATAANFECFDVLSLINPKATMIF